MDHYPTTIRLEDLDVICAVLDTTPADLLIIEPEAVAARRPQTVKSGNGEDQPARSPTSKVTPRLGRNRSIPPA